MKQATIEKGVAVVAVVPSADGSPSSRAARAI
jgi:hypothetical protein